MRYSPLAASYWALTPGGVCPTLSSFVKTPKLLVCGKATATPSAITIESAQAIQSDLFLIIILPAPDPKPTRRNGCSAEAYYINLGGPAADRSTHRGTVRRQQ